MAANIHTDTTNTDTTNTDPTATCSWWKCGYFCITWWSIWGCVCVTDHLQHHYNNLCGTEKEKAQNIQVH